MRVEHYVKVENDYRPDQDLCNHRMLERLCTLDMDKAAYIAENMVTVCNSKGGKVPLLWRLDCLK